MFLLGGIFLISLPVSGQQFLLRLRVLGIGCILPHPGNDEAEADEQEFVSDVVAVLEYHFTQLEELDIDVWGEDAARSLYKAIVALWILGSRLVSRKESEPSLFHQPAF